MTDTKATPATEPVCEWCGAYKSRHMDAYYYGFSATESPEVDRILCSVARAGKGAHHTESWDEYGFVQKIQDAAIACAARIAADAEIIKAARQERDSVKEGKAEAMNAPVKVSDALRLIELALEDCDKATPERDALLATVQQRNAAHDELMDENAALKARVEGAEKQVRVLEAAQLSARLACECGAFGRKEQEASNAR